jgi:hypothetical protein
MGFSLPIATDGLGEPASQFRIIIDTNLLLITTSANDNEALALAA